MRARLFWPLLLGLVACPQEPGDDTGDTAPQPGDFDFYIYTEVAPSGDLACYTAGTDWLTQTVDTDKQVTESVTEIIEDFEFDTAVADGTADIWLDDVVSGPPDLTQAANESGQVTFDLPVCTPMAYRTTVPPGLDTHKDTYESHQIFEPTAASPEPAPYNAVANSTYAVILNLLGVTPDDTLGVVAGTLYDCNGDPVTGAQVVVVDDDGNIPENSLTKYFIDEFPARDQEYTSPDGLWTAINLPPGTWNVQAYVADGDGGHLLIGATKLQIFADSINISNIYTGFGEGIHYPDSCLVEAR